MIDAPVKRHRLSGTVEASVIPAICVSEVACRRTGRRQWRKFTLRCTACAMPLCWRCVAR